MTASVTGCSTCRRVLTSRKLIDLDAPRFVDEELDRAGALIADGSSERDRTVADRGTGLGRDARRGRLLDDLLVAALDRALPLTQVDDVAVGIADDLHLDVAGAFDVRLDEDRAVTERRCGLARACRDRVGELVGAAHDAHATAAAAGCRLDERRHRDAVGDLHRPSSPAVISNSGAVGTPDSMASFFAATLSPRVRI